MSKKLNIGIDIDDTITETYYSILPIVSIKYGLDLNKLYKKKYGYKKLHKLLPNYKDFLKETYESIVKVVPLKENVIDIMNRIIEDGHRIVIITARDYMEYEDPYKLCFDYLNNHGIKFDKLIVNAKDKARVCLEENIDLFIDDNTRNCTQVSSSGVKTLQYHNDFTTNAHDVERVYGWNEIYNIVCEMSS